MTAPTLQDLIDSLPPNRRTWLAAVVDPLGLRTEVPISGGRSLDLAAESDLTFCKAETPELLDQVRRSASRFLVARPELREVLASAELERRALVISPTPRRLMAALLERLTPPATVAQQAQGIHPEAEIQEGTVVGPGAVIGADVRIGPECSIGPNTVIDHSTIGARTSIGANCTLGSDGFGYEVIEEREEVLKFPHFGRVRIGEEVDIGANTCIDRGSLSDTVIEDGAKIDNLVHVAHNCVIGAGALVIANVMIGGSARIGAGAWLAPSTSVINGGVVGDRALTGMAAVVIRPVEDNAVVVGMPAKKIRDRYES